MIHGIITALLFGLCCGIIGVTVNVVLPNEKILNWWFVLGSKVGIKIVNNVEQERWFYRPIWGCAKCFSGQISLWGYFLVIDRYCFFFHGVAVCTAILSAVFLSHIIKVITND